MTRGKLTEILTPDERQTLQWQAVVPVATNPFILLELVQMSFAASCAGLVIMGSGLWLVGGGLQPGDIVMLLQASVAFFVIIVAAFLCVTLVFFRNRYYASYSCSRDGIRYEGVRGRDESGSLFTWAVRPFAVRGVPKGSAPRARELPWDKIDRFVSFASMRSVQLKRGRWHLLRLYTPDAETHERLVAFLAARLQEVKA